MRKLWICAVGVLGCGAGDKPGVTIPPATIAAVDIAPSSVAVLFVGTVAVLSATARDAQGNALSGRLVSWSSSADNVASVSAAGAVTAVAAGTARIRATSEGKFAELAVTVRAQPWFLTGALTTGRTLLSLTLLANGSVLASGGQVPGTPFQTVRGSELYDPATGTWRSAGSLTTGRANHVAIRLQNGKVLVAGGYSIELSTRLATAELYDPATDAWTVTGSMTEARNSPEAALLADGRVLVAGGSGAGTNLNALATAEIYDPATGRWSAAGSMSVARAGHTITTLTNSTVIVVGGATGTFTAPMLHASAEMFDPATGAWSAAGSATSARAYHKALALPNGRLLITGGGDVISTAFPATDLYDATAGTWAASGALTAARTSHTMTVLSSGRVLVTGGGGSPVLGSSETFDMSTGRWTVAGDMRVARANHGAVLLLNGKVLVAGGQGTGAATSAEIYDPG